MLQNEEVLSQIILESPHYVFWKDENLVYVGCSRSFAQAIGFDSPDDVIGKSDHDLPWAGTYADDFRSEDMRVLSTGDSIQDKKVAFMLSKEGLKTFLVSKVPLYLDGVIVGVLCNCYDISHDEAKSRRLHRDSIFYKNLLGGDSNNLPGEGDEQSYVDALCHYYESIIACMPGNIYWLNKECVLMGGNDNLAKMFGLKSRSELVGLTYKMMSKLADWTEGQGDSFKSAEIEVMSTGSPRLNIEEPAVIIDGEARYYLGNKVPLRDKNDNIIGVIGISLDVTDKEKIKQDLVRSKDMALTASKSKSAFIANMSHDLRTPITGMLGMVQDMLNSSAEAKLSVNNTTSEQRKVALEGLVDTVESDSNLLMSSTDELLQLCNEILEVARIESGQSRTDVESFDLSKLVSHNVKLLQPTAQHKKLQLTSDIDKAIPRYLKGSRIYLARILLNLVGNSLKFTDKGEVKIRLQLLDADTSDISVGGELSLKILVEDTGIGIPEDKFDKIFEHFSRLTPSYEGLYKGAGLGLYTVKRYVEAMRGTIEVASELGEGTCFTVILPFTVADHADAPISSEHSPVPVKHDAAEKFFERKKSRPTKDAVASILVVEDSQLAAVLVRLNLESLACHVDVAEDGSTAVKMAEQGSYDLILMDIGLPDFSGIDASKKIRELSDPDKSQVPIVALSGHANNSDMHHEAIDAGMQDMITKPAKPEALESVLNRYVFKTDG